MPSLHCNEIVALVVDCARVTVVVAQRRIPTRAVAALPAKLARCLGGRILMRREKNPVKTIIAAACALAVFAHSGASPDDQLARPLVDFIRAVR
ncbi:MAG TPA: hypothetical protein VGP48_12385 [Stellaceae bacterium]|jgi:hypothetical protein|nr:hypothetical protein [Stellaceae bacterium]